MPATMASEIKKEIEQWDHVRRMRIIPALLARLQHDDEKARAAFTRAREEQHKVVQADTTFAPPICILGLIDAGLGRKKEALEERGAR
jgi:hypothetical protein